MEFCTHPFSSYDLSWWIKNCDIKLLKNFRYFALFCEMKIFFYYFLLTFHPLWKLNHKLQICRISTKLLIYELLRVFSNSLSFLFSMVVFRESLWITWKFGSISKSLSEKECRNSYFEACGYTIRLDDK